MNLKKTNKARYCKTRAGGKIVRLGDLGSLRITLSSEGKATAEEVTAHTAKTAGVIFTPGSKLKEMLANAKFTKI